MDDGAPCSVRSDKLLVSLSRVENVLVVVFERGDVVRPMFLDASVRVSFIMMLRLWVYSVSYGLFVVSSGQ